MSISLLNHAIGIHGSGCVRSDDRGGQVIFTIS